MFFFYLYDTIRKAGAGPGKGAVVTATTKTNTSVVFFVPAYEMIRDQTRK